MTTPATVESQVYTAVESIWNRATTDERVEKLVIPDLLVLDSITAQSYNTLTTTGYTLNIRKGTTGHPLDKAACIKYSCELDSEVDSSKITPSLFSVDEKGIFEIDTFPDEQPPGSVSAIELSATAVGAAGHILTICRQILSGDYDENTKQPIRYELKHVRLVNPGTVIEAEGVAAPVQLTHTPQIEA